MDRRTLFLCPILMLAGWTADSMAQGVDASPLVARNPLVSAVQREAPANLGDFIYQLDQLLKGTRPGGTRGPHLVPSKAELQLLAANPDFFAAYHRYPDDALFLLRQAVALTHASQDSSK